MSGQVFNKAHLFEDFRLIITKYNQKGNESTTGSYWLIITGQCQLPLLLRGLGHTGTYTAQLKSFIS